ncbi:MAG: 4-hydroxy-tetrahydrodipicolinate reductase [Chitinophagales bacterium]
MKIALLGYGKMGKLIREILEQQGDEVILVISDQNLSELTVQNLHSADVAIEFTQPDAAVANIEICLTAGVPVVVGTTGWLHRLAEVRSLCDAKNGAVFFSPNFSIGVNLFFEVNRKLAALMQSQPQYSFHVEEIHHTEKKDAPSGTAVKTAEIILSEITRKKSWTLNTDTPESFAINALRLPDVPGTHTVCYESGVDKIELRHEAKSRRGFAEGAVAAARWIIGKKGVFEMRDMLDIG